MRPRPSLVFIAGALLSACDLPAGPEISPELSLAIVSGDSQIGAPGTELPLPLTAVVQDARGRPVRNQLVNFQITAGGGSVFAGAAVSDRDGVVREWWTLGPEPGVNTLEARAVHPATGEKLVFATFTAIGEDEPAPGDPLQGTWTGTRGDGVSVTYHFTNLDRTETNPLTGNSAATYAGQFTGDGESVTFTAWLEGTLLYFGVTSRGELTGPNGLTLWSESVEPFGLTR
jgi:hypothetical protein